MTDWWRSLAPRERRTLAIGALAVLALLFHFLVWQPPREAADDLRERLVESRADLAWMRQALPRLEASGEAQQGGETARPSSDRALYALADETARAAGLGEALANVQPGGDRRVRVNLQDAVFDDLVRWLDTLSARHGLTVDTASLRRTDSTGRVDAQILLAAEEPS